MTTTTPTEAGTATNDAPEPTPADYDALRGDTDTAGQADPASTDSQHSDDDAGDDPGSNREAAKYRRKLRDTEAERDALRTRLEHVQRGEVERIATTHLRDGTDVWRDGAQLADLLDENGNVDTDKVSELGRQLTQAHPHWSTAQDSVRQRGMQSGASGPDLPRRDAFAAAFAPRAHD